MIFKQIFTEKLNSYYTVLPNIIYRYMNLHAVLHIILFNEQMLIENVYDNASQTVISNQF